MNTSKIRELIERPEFFDTPLARLIREELDRTDEPWKRPEVRHVDARQILAELDKRRRPEPKPKPRKRSLWEDIEGL